VEVRLEAVNNPAPAAAGCEAGMSVRGAALALSSAGLLVGALGEAIFKVTSEGRRGAESAACDREFAALSARRESLFANFESLETGFETTAGTAEIGFPDEFCSTAVF
jgi:hypothetical protein